MKSIWKQLKQSAANIAGLTKPKPDQPNRSSRSISKRTLSFQYEFQKLEDRRVLATFFLDANGSFFVWGTDADDVIVADVVQPNVRVTVNDTSQSRPLSQVQELVILGRAGDDQITNNTWIRSRMYGGDGNDTILGGWGMDRIDGNNGNDTITDRGGNNLLIGSTGINVIRGGPGPDTIIGGAGSKNTIYGGAGNDTIYAGPLGDVIYGEEGDDVIWGGTGDDILYGGSGADFLAGKEGNDSLYAEGSNNRLYGGPGNDGLFAGLGTGHTLGFGVGKNRVLVAPGQAVPQVPFTSAVIRFVNRSSDWTQKEIEAVDIGLRALHHRTNGTRILKDTTSSDPLTVVKYHFNDAVMGGNDGLNHHEVSVSISSNGTHTATYTREIRLRDFDENNVHESRSAALTMIHEIAHNWDSAFEINRVVPNGSVWNSFLTLSGWTTQNPNSSTFTQAPVVTQEVFEYQVVGNQLQIPTRQWWHVSTSQFIRDYGRNNAKEDWAVAWEYAFLEEVYGSIPANLGYTAVPLKVAKVNELFAALG